MRHVAGQARTVDAEFRADVISKLGRLGLVDDITGGLVYLASEASSLVTGSSLLIGGGFEVHLSSGFREFDFEFVAPVLADLLEIS